MSKAERPIPPAGKVVLSPPEFAALFGRHYTWAYRMITEKRVKVITETGRILIPRSEVDRMLDQAKHYTSAMPEENPGSADR